MRARWSAIAAVVAVAVAVAVAGASEARADDLRDQFGLGKGPEQHALPSCDDGLAFNCAQASDPLDAATPYALATWLPGSYLRRLPVGDATHEAVASYALGAGHDEVGPIFGGATGLESRWTIDGAPADSLETGAADTRVPLAFLDGLLVTAGGFSARDRASTGGTIDARLRRGTAAHEITADAWLSASRNGRTPPIIDYTLRTLATNAGPSATASLVATGPLGDRLGGHAWYAAGIAPTLASTQQSWRTFRQLDDDGDGVADGSVSFENLSSRTLDYDVPIMARAGLDHGVHQLTLSLIGNLARDSRFLDLATVPAAGVDRQTVVGDLSATWQARWADTRARVQLAWHRSARTESAHDAAAGDIPQLNTPYIQTTLADDPRLAAVCTDGTPDDPAPRIESCPVPGFHSAGAGLLTHVVGNRPSITGDLTQRFGDHVVRGGATLEDSRLSETARYTGGEDDFAAPGRYDLLARVRFYRGACSADPAEPCAYAPSSTLTYRTVYAAAYLEDTFTPVPGLAIDAGLRWELMWLGSELRFDNQLAPRAGVTWDPLGGGRTRLWASYGRSFAMLPAGLGATVIGHADTVVDFSSGGRELRPGTPVPVAAGTEPIHQDEITAGAEVALVGALRATVWGQGRWLHDGLDATQGSFGNPGAGGQLGATRETELVAASLEMAQQDKLTIRAGVLWGRTVGTWVGPYDPARGITLLQDPTWDGGTRNFDGALPTDAGGQAFFEAERRLMLGPVGLAVATRLAVASGRPRSALGRSADGGLVEILPRGALGRGPVIAQANVRLAARWRATTVTLDIFNLFDRRDVTRVDELYSDDVVQPIAHGTAADLAALQTTSGQPAVPRAAFQRPIAFQAPLSITLGVHRAF